MMLLSKIKSELKTWAYNFYWRKEIAYIQTFLSEMQKKAVSFGVTDSIWQTPSGMGIINRISPRGLIQIAAKATCSDIIRDIWSCDSASIHVSGKNEREIELQHIMNYPPLRESYQILGWKSGTCPDKERLHVSCVMAVQGRTEDQIMLGAVMDCPGKLLDPDRYIALKELFDAASQSEAEQPEAKDIQIPHAGKACCGILRTDSDELSFPINLNAETLSVPASTTKLLSCLTALDYLSLDEEVKILPYDLVKGSGQIFQSKDIVTVRDLLYAALLPSSNQAARALARCAGKRIQKTKKKEKSS